MRVSGASRDARTCCGVRWHVIRARRRMLERRGHAGLESAGCRSAAGTRFCAARSSGFRRRHPPRRHLPTIAFSPHVPRHSGGPGRRSGPGEHRGGHRRWRSARHRGDGAAGCFSGNHVTGGRTSLSGLERARAHRDATDGACRRARCMAPAGNDPFQWRPSAAQNRNRTCGGRGANGPRVARNGACSSRRGDHRRSSERWLARAKRRSPHLGGHISRRRRSDAAASQASAPCGLQGDRDARVFRSRNGCTAGVPSRTGLVSGVSARGNHRRGSADRSSCRRNRRAIEGGSQGALAAVQPGDRMPGISAAENVVVLNRDERRKV